ncbi:hypothetical protein [Halarsenatibacter silvermanii]|uniref:Uncharacterized protein n=1 Tax=Halarsenatibacter silvermanii TaxID=321763 RepID=A0A1G9M2Y4_9FIRM|nr:hypothetical protein [Halarsenatibacter silvermanii]SDL68055.1 hypothetical protein SAMN04488692_10776 [Halarsenatibacter silvermanii]
MEVIIDGEKQDVSQYKSDEDFQQLLAEIKSNLDDKIVNTLVINDEKNVDPNRPQYNPSLDEIDKIEIGLRDVEDLIEETVNTLVDYVPNVRRGFKNAQVEFNFGDDDEGFNLLEQALQGFQWCLSVTTRIAQMEDSEKLKDMSAELSGGFQEMLDLVDIDEEMQNEEDMLINRIDELLKLVDDIEEVAEKLVDKYDIEADSEE